MHTTVSVLHGGFIFSISGRGFLEDYRQFRHIGIHGDERIRERSCWLQVQSGGVGGDVPDAERDPRPAEEVSGSHWEQRQISEETPHCSCQPHPHSQQTGIHSYSLTIAGYILEGEQIYRTVSVSHYICGWETPTSYGHLWNHSSMFQCLVNPQSMFSDDYDYVWMLNH